MKKIRFAGLLLAPLVLLCSCTSASELRFDANWYKNTMTTHPRDTYEKLEYEVTFTPPSSESAVSVNYDRGTYTTELKNETISLSDGSSIEGYVYTTELSISGRYTVNGSTGETFADSVRSVVKVLPVDERLRPVESEKTVISTSAVTGNPSKDATVDSVIQTYRYSYTVQYDLAMTTATVNFTDLSVESPAPVVKELDIEGDSSYLDNEEITLALRGLNLASGASFRTINPVANAVQSISVTSTAIEDYYVEFESDGVPVARGIPVYSASVSYNTSVSGLAQTVYCAATTDTSNNVYRNAIVCMEVPLFWSLGTLKYNLVKAQFATK